MELTRTRGRYAGATAVIAITMGALGGSASASSPANGTVSASSPKTKWSGAVQASWFYWQANNVTEGAPPAGCEQPYCDSFTLSVADGGDLKLTGSVPPGTGTGASVTLRVTNPGGATESYTGEAAPDKPFAQTIKSAAVGSYVIDYMSSYVDGNDYTATAELLNLPKPEPVVVAPAPEVAAPAPAPAQAPTPAKPVRKSSRKAQCEAKAKKQRGKSKRTAALKRCKKIKAK